MLFIYRTLGALALVVFAGSAVTATRVKAPRPSLAAAPAIPGLPFAEQLDAPLPAAIQDHDDEKIDPFTGSLQLTNVDLQLPGNGGFDLKVTRSYTSNVVARNGLADVDPYTPRALGWTVHYGRLLVREQSCSGSTGNTNFMPLLETPDGVRRLVWGVQQAGSPAMMTVDSWAVMCSGSGYLIISPDGTRYDMQFVHTSGLVPCPNALHPDQQCSLNIFSTTKVTDRNGNYATIGYQSYLNPRALGLGIWNEPQITQVSTSDGRTLNFTYSIYGNSEESKRPYLTSIVASTGQRISYAYTLLSADLDVYALTSAQDPAARTWSYQYQIPRQYTDSRCNVQVDCPFIAGDLLLKTVTSPWGGVRTFTWVGMPIRYTELAESTPVGVATKVTSDGGTWSYSYSYSPGNLTLTTTADSPVGRSVYVHRWERGDSNPLGTLPGPWTNGLILSQTDGGVKSTSYVWNGQPISDGWSSLVNINSSLLPRVPTRPVVVSKTVVLDGATHTATYSSFDAYGNVGTIGETGVNGGNRTTSRTYFTDTAKWIIGKLKDESFTGGSTTRTFYANGNLASLSRDGVTVAFEYDLQGNLTKKTLPRGLVHTYSSYKRGIAQSESQPEGINLARVVDDSGNVTSRTDGEGKTTGYTFDSIGRETSVAFPIGNPKTTVYGTTTTTMTRGGLVQLTQFDGFGRSVADTMGGIKTTIAYNPLGMLTFQSDPASTTGKSYQYDVLGRVIQLTNADGSYQIHTYGAATKTITDERGKSTTYAYRAYSDPSRRFLMGIYPADATANLALARNARDLISSVTQGGFTRSYGYNANYFVSGETNPETGSTSYGRDAAGNMTSRTVGASGTTSYGYDGQNRVTSITYPGSTPAVTYTYSKTNRRLTAYTVDVNRDFVYDANGNLTGEGISGGGLVLAAGYGYNANDQLASMVYPRSGQVVNYYPDVLGRPTQVSGYVSNVTYWPSGMPLQISYVNGTVSTYGQNSRLWPSSFITQKAGVASYINSSYGYDGVGNLLYVTDTVDANLNRGLGYDDIGRLITANGPWGGGTISYSGVGNITSQAFGGSTLSYSYDGTNRLASVSGARSASYGYDAYGDVIAAASNVYTYDGVPNLQCVNCQSGVGRVDYWYDGTNSRVLTVKGTNRTYEMYGSDGKLLVEFTPAQSNRLVEYIYLGNMRIAQRATPF